MPAFPHPAETVADPIVAARLHESHFAMADSNFYSLTRVADGSLYYTLSSHNIDTHGRVFRYEPEADRLSFICDLGEAAGQAGSRKLPQGKSHSPFFEIEGKLYFATHYGFFASTAQREHPAEVPDGYEPYPGGHILCYDPATGRTGDLAVAPPEEGILTLAADTRRGALYGLTWPGGYFLRYDIASGTMSNYGQVCGGGEGVTGENYYCLVRALAVDPRDGSVYFTLADGALKRYNPETDAVELVDAGFMVRDIFGRWDHARPGHQGYNWRDILWHEPSQSFLGVHPKSAWLFSFDPRAMRLRLHDRICCEHHRRSGAYELFRYGYLTLQLDADGDTIYYLTGRDVAAADNEPVADKPNEDWRRQGRIHLISYKLSSGLHRDHGVLRLEDGRYPLMSQCHAIGPDDRLYTCPWIEKTPEMQTEGLPKAQCDLISFPKPR